VSQSAVKTLGVLNPGLMGSSVARALVDAGHRVNWASENRSQATAERATTHNLIDCENLATMSAECEVIFSVCPPAEALSLARTTADSGFNGVFVDCNAVAPGTGQAVAQIMTAAGVDYVDGGIIGPPAWTEGTTRLYLSGTRAAEIASLFTGSLMGTVNLGNSQHAASAMKMAYAAWTKGSAALLLSIYALAEHHGLGDALKEEWNLSQPGLENKLDGIALGNAPKAWRFVGEMEQIAATLAAAGQNPGAFESAAEIYSAMSSFKTAKPQDMTTDAVVRSILQANTASKA